MLDLKTEVSEAYPSTTFGIMRMTGITCQNPPAEFVQAKRELEKAVRQRFFGMDKKEMRSLSPFSHYHKYYKKYKKTYHVLHQCESIVSGKRNLPDGTPLVQALFMAEIHNQLLTAGYDCRDLNGPFSVTLADGATSFTGMGNNSRTPPKNDIVFSSGQRVLGSIICGPDHEHRIQADTENVLFAVYGVPGISPEQITRHLEETAGMVRLFDPKSEIDFLSVL